MSLEINNSDTYPQDLSTDQGRQRVKRRASSIDTQSKIGLAKRLMTMTKADFLRNRFKRKMILVVPDEIREKHPDKHFAFVSMNKLQKMGMYHTNGYRPFNLSEDPTAISSERFQANNLDNYLHRNEMVLAWIPKEEHEMRLLEEEFFRKDRDLGAIIKNHPDLSEFRPHAKQETERLSISDLLADEANQPKVNGGQHG